jgi:hypothetical protein
VRFEAAYGVNGSSTNVQGGDLNNRYTNDLWYRVRGYITADARNQTEYGTVRGYIAVGISTNTVFDPPQTINANRAFVQWAGFTFGRAQSFFDFFSQAAIGYLGFTPNSDTGDGGWEVAAYTAQLGNGFSASLSAEARRTTQIIGQGDFASSMVSVPGFPGTFTSVAPNAGSISGGAVAATPFAGQGYAGLESAGHRRQSARRPGLGFSCNRGCPTSGQCELLHQHSSSARTNGCRNKRDSSGRHRSSG